MSLTSKRGTANGLVGRSVQSIQNQQLLWTCGLLKVAVCLSQFWGSTMLVQLQHFQLQFQNSNIWDERIPSSNKPCWQAETHLCHWELEIVSDSTYTLHPPPQHSTSAHLEDLSISAAQGDIAEVLRRRVMAQQESPATLGRDLNPKTCTVQCPSRFGMYKLQIILGKEGHRYMIIWSFWWFWVFWMGLLNLWNWRKPTQQTTLHRCWNLNRSRHETWQKNSCPCLRMVWQPIPKS